MGKKKASISKKKYSLNEIKKARLISSWWIILLEPIASRVTWLIANFTNLKPNTLTIIGGTMAFIAAFLMFNGYLIFGAVLFEIYYIFDMVDGRIARLKNLSSKGGKCLDYLMDRIIIFSLTLALVFNFLDKPGFAKIVLLGFLFVFIEIFSLHLATTTNQVFSNGEKRDLLLDEDTKKISQKNILLKKYVSIKNYLSKFGLPVLPSGIEAIHIAFFIGPITGKIFWCFLIGVFILIFSLIATISFTSYVFLKLKN